MRKAVFNSQKGRLYKDSQLLDGGIGIVGSGYGSQS